VFNETEIKQIVAISVLLATTKCTKFVFSRGSAPDPAGGAHDAPPDPLVGWGGGHPLPIPAFRHFFFHSLSTAWDRIALWAVVFIAQPLWFTALDTSCVQLSCSA